MKTVTPERLEVEAYHREDHDAAAAGWLRLAARTIRHLEARIKEQTK